MRQIILIYILYSLCSALHAQTSWTQLANFPDEPRLYPSGFCIGSKCYLGIGGDFSYGAPNYNDFWEWDSNTNVWSQKLNFFPGPRTLAVGFAIGQLGYLATGYKSYNGSTSVDHIYNDLWEYYPSNDTWIQKASVPHAPDDHCSAFVIGSKAYIIFVDQQMWEWDQNTNIWTRKADYPGEGREWPVTFAIGNKGYCGLGVPDTTTNAPQDFWEWDQQSDVWSRKADFPCATSNGKGFALNGQGYIGFINPAWDTTKTRKIWRYDPGNDTWTYAARFPGSQPGIGAVISNGIKAYFAFQGAAFPDFWEFNPGDLQTLPDVQRCDLALYPNPAKDRITISFTNVNAEAFSLKIKNLVGEAIYEEAANKFPSGLKNKTMDVSNYPRGVYIVEMTCGGQRIVRKFVVE